MFRMMSGLRTRLLRLSARARHRNRFPDGETEGGAGPRLFPHHSPHPPARTADRSLKRSTETLDGVHPSGEWSVAVDHDVLGPNDDRDLARRRISTGRYERAERGLHPSVLEPAGQYRAPPKKGRNERGSWVLIEHARRTGLLDASLVQHGRMVT